MEQGTPRFEKRYKAFISYSHADNKEQGRKWADWLHHSLETYQIPAELVGQTNQHGQKIPAQIYPVFQDEKELSANADLSASLQNALDHAEFLIYLSSPRSARSVYVQEEIKHFKKTGKGQNIIALIVRGEPEYGETQTEQQCFPDALRFAVDADGQILYHQREEALAADVRLPHSTEEGFTSVEAYRRHLQEQGLSSAPIKHKAEEYQERLNLAKLKIISGILGVPLGELTKRDQAYQLERIKRKNRTIKRVAAAISALAVTATGAGIYAWNQKNEAQKNLAQSLYASGINKLAQNEYGDPAAYIAAAVRNGSGNATQFAESMLAIKDDMVLLPNMQSANTVFSPDGRYVAGFVDDGIGRFNLQLWDAHTRQKITDIAQTTTNSPGKPAFDNQNRLYVVNGQNEVVRYQPDTQQSSVVYRSAATEGFALSGVSPDGNWLVLRQFGQDVLSVVFSGDNTPRWNMAIPQGDIATVLFSPDSQTALVLAYNNSGNSGQIVHLNQRQPIRAQALKLPLSGTSFSARFSPNGKSILLSAGGNTHVLLDAQNGQSQPLQTQGKFYNWVAFSPDNQSVTALSDQGYDVYDARTGGLKTAHAVPMDRLQRALQENSPDISPAQTQRLAVLNRQTYLQNLGSRNLLISEQYFAPSVKQLLADATGTHLLALQADGKTIAKVNVETGANQKNFITLAEAADYFRVLDNGLLMAVSPQKTVSFYDTKTAQSVGKPVQTQARRIIFDKDNARFLARTGDNSFAIWNIRDGAEVMRYNQEGSLGNFITDDNFKFVLMADKQGWKLTELAGKKTVLEGKEDLTSGIFSPDGRWLAVSNSAGQADVYDLAKHKKQFSVPTVAAPILRFSPDGQILLASENVKRMRLWHTATGQPYGQVIPVFTDTKLLQFSADNSKLFLQDSTDANLAPAIKVIDTASGNLISLPFAAGLYNSMQLLDADSRIATVQKLPEGYQAQIWQVPGGQKLNPEQLATDLETFYGRKYDAQTGAINNYDGKKQFSTWYFQDIYTRPIAPNSQTTVIQAIERLLPVENDDNLQLLSAYFYHPLARAGLAEYFSRQPGAGALSAELVRLTRLQLAGIGDAKLKQQTEAMLAQAEQTSGKSH